MITPRERKIEVLRPSISENRYFVSGDSPPNFFIIKQSSSIFTLIILVLNSPKNSHANVNVNSKISGSPFKGGRVLVLSKTKTRYMLSTKINGRIQSIGRRDLRVNFEVINVLSKNCYQRYRLAKCG